MCGIVAIFAPDEPLPPDEELQPQLEAAIEKIAHRGPDARGYWISDSSRCGG